MRNPHRIDEAIADLRTQDRPNVQATAEKYDVARKTLDDRWKGKSVSMRECVSTHRQCLTDAQEKALISIINDLTNRNMPPTSAIVKNLAQEIRGCDVGKNWTASFVRRNQEALKSQYLTNIDNKRVHGEHPEAYQSFYKLVKCYLRYINFLEYL
jgi:hypothetical protein